MKTKIIYISGGEVFDMADIRAAFDTVRDALALSRDTILFGVPVDADDALCDINIAQNVATTEIVTENTNITTDIDSVTITDKLSNATPDPVITDDTPVVTDTPVDTPIDETPIIDIEPEIIPEKPKKARRGRPKSAPTPVADVVETPNDVIEQPVVETDDAPIVTPVPILSVLASKVATDSEIVDEAATPDTVDAAPEIQSDIDLDNAPADLIVDDATSPDMATVIADDAIDDAPVADEIDVVHVTLDATNDDDAIIDAAPMPAAEKTLEELLESMAPLREDYGNGDDDADDTDTTQMTAAPDTDDIVDENIAPADSDDDDATLARLANEFVASEDKIVTPSRTNGHGKIGKLKNILPFKKVKRDEGGLMGDLFGWAGIAANDEDFSIPGFFTNASGNK